MELRSWYGLNGASNTGFKPEGNGRGMVAEKERQTAEFPVEKALDLLRLKCLSFSVCDVWEGSMSLMVWYADGHEG